MPINDLIFEIYNAIEEPETWQDVLSNIAKELDSSHIFLAARNGVDQQPFAFVESGFSKGHFESYQEYYYQVDMWTQGLLNHKQNQFHSSHVVVDDKKFLNSELYNDFAKPADIRHSMGCLMRDSDNGMLAEVGIMRGKNSNYYDEATRLKANQLIVHVQQSITISQKLRRLEAKASDFQSLMNVAADAMFVCLSAGELVEHNQNAYQFLHEGKVLKTDQLNRLYFLDHSAQYHFMSYREQYNSSYTSNNGCAFFGKSESFLYRVKVQPWLHTKIHSLGASKVPAMIVSIRPIQGKLKQNQNEVLRFFKLTESEAEIVSLLCTGFSAEGIAKKRSSSISTVRQQIKSCLQKTNTHKQSELVAKILAFTID